jgi:NAD(P)-dependent dehydrogenase (short-subunit alcohol dehydrogenase family)
MIAEATTALVTGATGALGRAIAQALAAEGARVVDAGRREGALRHLAASLRPRLPRAAAASAAPRTTQRRKPPWCPASPSPTTTRLLQL